MQALLSFIAWVTTIWGRRWDFDGLLPLVYRAVRLQFFGVQHTSWVHWRLSLSSLPQYRGGLQFISPEVLAAVKSTCGLSAIFAEGHLLRGKQPQVPVLASWAYCHDPLFSLPSRPREFSVLILQCLWSHIFHILFSVFSCLLQELVQITKFEISSSHTVWTYMHFNISEVWLNCELHFFKW